jgi:hypothetical protein
MEESRCRKRRAAPPDDLTVSCILLQCSMHFCKPFSPEAKPGGTKALSRDNWGPGHDNAHHFFLNFSSYDHARLLPDRRPV